MSRKSNFWWATILVLVLPTIMVSGCGKVEQTEEKANAAAKAPKASDGEPAQAQEKLLTLDPDETRKAGIRVERLQWQESSKQITVTATIKPNQNKLARVEPRVSGRIIEVRADFGDSVRQGQTLALLNSIELGDARSAYLQAQSNLDLAQANFARAERLSKDQIIPQKDYLRARANLAKAQATLRTATDRLRLLGVDPGSVAGNGSDAVFPVIAPLAGTIIDKRAVVGEVAQANQPVFTVADLSTLWIEADLFEKDLSEVKVGVNATVSVAAYPDEHFQGRLTYISSTMDPVSRTVKARVEVPNPDGKLKPGMFATVAIDSSAGGKALILPEVAVVLMQDRPTVFAAEKGGFEPHPVKVGERFAGKVVIRSGLTAGESVVVSGAYSLKARMLKSQIGDTD